MRCRITFSKTEAMRFTGHLDLHRALERTMRRAQLPLAYSEGFTPRPKLQLASALPLGFTSQAEVADFWLKEEMPVEEIEQAFVAAQPPGVKLNSLEEVSLQADKLQTSLRTAAYQVSLPEPMPNLNEKVSQLLKAENLLIERTKKGKKKTQDIRPLIFDISLAAPAEAEKPILEMILKAEEGATGRPDHVLQALGVDPLIAYIHRTQLNFS